MGKIPSTYAKRARRKKVAIAAPASDSEGEEGQTEEPKPPEPDDDEALLHEFHVALAREIATYKADEKKPAGLEKAGWSEESKDINIGVLAVDRAMRGAAKAVTGEDDLFGAPPSPDGPAPLPKK